MAKASLDPRFLFSSNTGPQSMGELTTIIQREIASILCCRSEHQRPYCLSSVFNKWGRRGRYGLLLMQTEKGQCWATQLNETRKILNHFWRSLGLWEAAHLLFFYLEKNMVLQFVSYFLKIHFAQLKTARGHIKKATSANTSLWHWAASASSASTSPISFITHCIIQTKFPNNKNRKLQKAAPHLILFMDCNTHSDRSLFALPSLKSKEKL